MSLQTPGALDSLQTSGALDSLQILGALESLQMPGELESLELESLHVPGGTTVLTYIYLSSYIGVCKHVL